jgi:hypothetical protein
MPAALGVLYKGAREAREAAHAPENREEEQIASLD